MWEKFDKHTDRLRVPGGWIVRSLKVYGDGCSVHQVFIEDKNHTWELEEKGHYKSDYPI